MNYTNINQSKKLVELGIDPNTADMYYETHKNYNDDGTEQTFVKIGEFPKLQFKYYDYIPCWSTGALIDLLPVEIEGFDFKKNGQYWNLSILEYFSYNDVYFKVKYGKGEIAFEEHKLIDALIKMIEWLTKNKYL